MHWDGLRAADEGVCGFMAKVMAKDDFRQTEQIVRAERGKLVASEAARHPDDAATVVEGGLEEFLGRWGQLCRDLADARQEGGSIPAAVERQVSFA